MKLDPRSQHVPLMAFGAALYLFASAAMAQSYTWQELPLQPTGMNNKGQVVGSGSYVFDLNTGIRTDLRAQVSGLIDVKDSGQWVTQTRVLNPDGTLGFVSASSLGSSFTPIIQAVNEKQGAAGFVVTRVCYMNAWVGNLQTSSGYLLGSLGGGRAVARGINDLDQVAGMSTVEPSTNCSTNPTFHAFYGSAALGLRDLHAPGMDARGSSAVSINNAGLVAGDYYSGELFPAINASNPLGFALKSAVVWDTAAGTYKRLGPAGQQTVSVKINGANTVVGNALTFAKTYTYSQLQPDGLSSYAFVANALTGSYTDLNRLVSNLPAGMLVRTAIDMNELGQIVVMANDGASTTKYMVLTPSAAAPTVTPLPTVPAAPTGLRAGSLSYSPTAVSLTWTDNAKNETSFVLERCAGRSCTNFLPHQTLGANATSTLDGATNVQTTYRYRVSARNVAGTSAPSNIVSFTVR